MKLILGFRAPGPVAARYATCEKCWSYQSAHEVPDCVDAPHRKQLMIRTTDKALISVIEKCTIETLLHQNNV